MDLNILIFGIVSILTLGLLGLIRSTKVLAVFPLIGGFIGIFFTLSLFADGSITFISAGTTSTIASASLSITSAWQFISMIPLALTVTDFILSGYKAMS